MKGFLGVLVLCLVPCPLRAGAFGSSARGTTTASFLKLGVGARAAALGEAYSAVVNEASALYWNPAALVLIPERSVTFMHAAHLDSSFFDYVAYGQNLGKYGAYGLGVQYFSAGGITRTDETGADIGRFTPYDLAASLGYAKKLQWFSLGLTVRFIRSQIINSAQTVAGDFGMLSPGLSHGKLRLAFTVSNLGGKMRFGQEEEALPFALRVGSSYRVLKRWSCSLDMGFPKDNNPYIALGTEYLWLFGGVWGLAGRLGFNSRTIRDIDGVAGAAFGVGLVSRKFSLDYALLPFGSVGFSHRVSVSSKF